MRNLRLLHSLHIAHRDLKPSNLLFSKSLGKFVLCDFGISAFVKENVGELSMTECVGTPLYMGPEMLVLLRTSSWKMQVDLYYNDACGFLKSMNQINSEFIKGEEVSCNMLC